MDYKKVPVWSYAENANGYWLIIRRWNAADIMVLKGDEKYSKILKLEGWDWFNFKLNGVEWTVDRKKIFKFIFNQWEMVKIRRTRILKILGIL